MLSRSENVICVDPVYMVSSENDHARATLEARTCAEKLVSVQQFFFLCWFFGDNFTVNALHTFRLNQVICCQ